MSKTVKDSRSFFSGSISHHLFILYITLHVIFNCSVSVVRAETVYEAIRNHPNLTRFLEYVEKDTITKIWLQERTATVFAPTNEAFDRVSRSQLDDSSVGPYHVIGATITKDKFPAVLSSTKQIAAPHTFSYRDPHPEAPGLLPHAPQSHPPIGQREYFVDNAKILEEKGRYQGSTPDRNVQILYIIDEVLIPYIPQNAGISPTANEFLQKRITYGNEGSAPSDYFSEMVRRFELESLFDRPGNNTFFLPLITSSDSWRVRNLDADIVRAHVIPNKNLFFRTIEGNTEYKTAAWNDKIQVGISLPISPEIAANLSSRAASRIQSRTHKSENKNHHIGIVRTSIVKPNIPVRNGVVHFIDKPFMVIDISVWDFIDTNKDGQISRFYDLLMKSNRANTARDSGRTLTIFAPNNEAFEKVGKKLDWYTNDTQKINDLIALHIVDGYSVNTDSVRTGKYAELTSSDGKTPVYFGVAQATENTEVLTVEGVGVNSTCVQADIGATNGVVHIVDKILGIPYQSVYEKVKDDFDLRTTYTVGSHRNDWWNREMSTRSSNKRFTYFAPSKAAWNKLKAEMPSEYKQLTEGMLPVHGEQILDRHLRVHETEAIDFNELGTRTSIKTKRGELAIEKGPNGEVFLLWEGLKAKVTRPDVKAINGVIHVIDTVLMKKRDMTTSAAIKGTSASTFTLLSLFITTFFAVTKKSML